MRIQILSGLYSFALLGFAQTTPSFDSSGTSLLHGAYNFRQVVYGNFDAQGAIGSRTALYGTITFDGKGNYSLTGQKRDSSANAAQPYSTTGTYAVAPSGLASIQSPLYDNERVSGLVSRGVLLGSSTEGSTNDIFVALAAGAQPATNATVQGSYWIASIDFPAADPAQTRDALFRITADGQGGIAAATATGYVGTSPTAVNQSLSAFNYSLTNGAGTISFPQSTGAQTVISGTKNLYVSPNGDFLLGGSADGYDLVFGIRANTSNLEGVYYNAGLDQDNSDLAGSGSFFDTFWGSMKANNGQIWRHDRFAAFDSSAYDYNFDDAYATSSGGSYEGSAFRYAAGSSGTGLVGIGKAPYLGFFVSVKSPDFTPSGVFINPVGVVNAASSAPFTAGLARGELITIYGSNLANSIAVASSAPFASTLAGVQVTVNGRPAPIYSVSPSQVSAIVPYATELTFARIQVNNNGTASNTVTSFMNTSAPGVFTVPPGGIGYGAVLHPDYSLVTPKNPAKRGETLQVFLTGLGDVNPAVPEGAAGPLKPLSTVVNMPDVYIDGVKSTVAFAGLAPGLAGLYQINVQVPQTAGSGDVYLDVDGPDSVTSQVKITVQ